MGLVGGSHRKGEVKLDPLRIRDWAEAEVHFTEMPEKPIAAFLGKEGFSRRARLKHQGDRSVLAYEHFSLVWLIVWMAVLGCGIAALLMFGDRIGLEEPEPILVYAFMGTYGSALIPLAVALFHRSNLRYLGYGDLLVVTAGDETVTLQDGKIRAKWGDLRAVTEIRGYFRRKDKEERIRQICVVLATDTGFRQVPIATVKAASEALAPKVAKLLHVPLLRGFKPKRRVRNRWRRKRT
jgi:hypothetical protein